MNLKLCPPFLSQSYPQYMLEEQNVNVIILTRLLSSKDLLSAISKMLSLPYFIVNSILTAPYTQSKKHLLSVGSAYLLVSIFYPLQPLALFSKGDCHSTHRVGPLGLSSFLHLGLLFAFYHPTNRNLYLVGVF